MQRTFDAQHSRVEEKAAALIPLTATEADTRLLELLLGCESAAKLHVVEFVARRSSLLHLLDRLERLVVLARLLTGEEREDAHVPVE